MAELTPLVEAWVRYAEDDWQDSQILASAGGNRRSVCFHLQQCIEKLFKAELMRLEVPVPKTHNLRELSDLLQQADAGWSAASIRRVPPLCWPTGSNGLSCQGLG